MRVRPVEFQLFLRTCETRLPFRFGISTLTRAPLGLCRVVIETDHGSRAEGFSSDLLVPKWFEKDPSKSIDQDIHNLIDSTEAAGAMVLEAGGPSGSAFDLWWELYRHRVESQPPDAPDRLVRGFGVALVERAMMDAVCRAAGVSFFKALGDNLFGFDPARLDSDFVDLDPRSLFVPPPSHLHVRHTIGMVDALRTGDIPDGERVADGLPESLEEDIRASGLRFFKIKVCGDVEQDVDRMMRISRTFDACSVHSPQITLDGNEQYESMGDLIELLTRLNSNSLTRRLIDGLLHIEQPLSRNGTFDPDRNSDIDVLGRFAPVIIDEADTGVDSLPRAVALGYRGISIKNCKGVFRAILNRGRCVQSGGHLFQAGEDLTNLPVIALQQDLATQAALGMTHVERNGHHYFRGLDYLSTNDQRAAVERHPDLYQSDANGVRLRIETGRLAIGSLACPGYAHCTPPDVGDWTLASEWSW